MTRLTPYETAAMRHGLQVSIKGQPVLPALDPNSDAERTPTEPAAFTTTAFVRTETVKGLADVYDMVLSVSYQRRVVDGVQLGVLAGFVFDQATVTVNGVAFRVNDYDPVYFRSAPEGFDLKLGR